MHPTVKTIRNALGQYEAVPTLVKPSIWYETYM